MGTRPRKKLKIDSKNKSYPVQDSPFYKLSSKKQLADLLHTDLGTLKSYRCEIGYRVFTVRTGVKDREIQQPIGNLDLIHTRCASLMARLEAPEYLHSGRKARTHISNAAVHTGYVPVLTVDIKSFFPKTSRKQVFKFFANRMKMAPDVAKLLSEVLTFREHVPTGSRLSMILAFWAAHDMFDELYRLSLARSIRMTVYVDDLTFSGVGVNRLFLKMVTDVVRSYGYELHPGKTAFYDSKAVKLVTGVAISGHNLMVGNSKHKDIYQDLVQWLLLKDRGLDIPSLKSRLLGRLNAQGQIDFRLKDKARSIRKETI